MDAELSFSVADTSLDPVSPRVRAEAVAVHHGHRQRQHPRRRPADQHRSAAGRSHGRSARPRPVRLSAAQRGADPPCARPPRRAGGRHAAGRRRHPARRVGPVNLHDERIAVRVNGDANLGILQGFVPNVRSTGRATLEAAFEGPCASPLVNGTMLVAGRPHPSFRPAARAREHLGSRALRLARRHGSTR